MILSGNAIWAVVDRQSRQMVSPVRRGVEIEGMETGLENKIPGPLRCPPTDRESVFVVPRDYLDNNGHMNNTRYFDLAEACTGLYAAQRGLREVTAEYINEALEGQRLRIFWTVDGDSSVVLGQSDTGRVFRMKLTYGE